MVKTAKREATKKRGITLEKALPWIMVIFGAIALFCSVVIMVEKTEIWKNPDHVTSCDVNPVISCGSVMRSDQADAFGFPNPYLGLIGFPIVITIGVAMLAGAQFRRWFWIATLLGMTFAVGFVHWLFFQAVYRIGALCPYCIGLWISTIAAFWYVLLYVIKQKYIKLPSVVNKVTRFTIKHHLDILLVWYLIIAILILKRFWYYFGTFL